MRSWVAWLAEYQFLIGYISNLDWFVTTTEFAFGYQFLIGYISNPHISMNIPTDISKYQFLIGYISNFSLWQSPKSQEHVSIPYRIYF